MELDVRGRESVNVNGNEKEPGAGKPRKVAPVAPEKSKINHGGHGGTEAGEESPAKDARIRDFSPSALKRRGEAVVLSRAARESPTAAGWRRTRSRKPRKVTVSA